MSVALRHIALWASVTIAYGILAHIIMVQWKLEGLRSAYLIQLLFTFVGLEFLRFMRIVKITPYAFQYSLRCVFMPTLCYVIAEEMILDNLNTNKTPYFAVVHRHFPIFIAIGGLLYARQRPYTWHILLLMLVAISCYGSRLTVLIAYEYNFIQLLAGSVAVITSSILMLWSEYALTKISLLDFLHAHFFNSLIIYIYREYLDPQLLDFYMDLRYGTIPPFSFYLCLSAFLAFSIIYQFTMFFTVFKTNAITVALIYTSASNLQIGAMYYMGMYASLFTQYPSMLSLIGAIVNVSTSLVYVMLRSRPPAAWQQALLDINQRRKLFAPLAHLALPMLNDGGAETAADNK